MSNIRSIFFSINLIISLVLLTSCGGGGGGGGGVTPDTNGIWNGSLRSDGLLYPVEAIVYEGEVYIYSINSRGDFSGEFYMSGQISQNENTLRGNLSGRTLYEGAYYPNNATIQAEINNQETVISGTSEDSFGVDTFSVNFQEVWDTPPDLANLFGTYRATEGRSGEIIFSADTQGVFVGEVENYDCTWETVFTPINDLNNYYSFTSGCIGNNRISNESTGHAYQDEDGNIRLILKTNWFGLIGWRTYTKL